eukprot:5416526-Prymnesium_polylepis.1
MAGFAPGPIDFSHPSIAPAVARSCDSTTARWSASLWTQRIASALNCRNTAADAARPRRASNLGALAAPRESNTAARCASTSLQLASARPTTAAAAHRPGSLRRWNRRRPRRSASRSCDRSRRPCVQHCGLSLNVLTRHALTHLEALSL